jgi:tetratricopeptide (TPR) repeat protein
MVSRHSIYDFLHPFRALPPSALFLVVLLLQQGSLRLFGQTPASPGEPAVAKEESSNQSSHSPSANPDGPRHPVATSLRAADHGVPRQENSLSLERSAISCLRGGDFAGAIQAYKQALELNPNDPDLKLGLARALSLSGYSEESKSLYQQLLSKNPDHADALEGLGNAFLRSNHPFEARAIFQRLTASHPANPEFQIALARVETRLGHYKHAREILSAVLTFHPHQREARLQLAYVKLYQGRYAAALADFTQLLKADPTDFEALLGNARAYYYRGDIAYSYALVSKLVKDRPNDYDAVFLLANLERARQHPQQALELLTRANQLSPGNTESLQLERTLRQERAPTFHASASYAREISAGNGSLDFVGFSGQDLRRFGYESVLDFSALPRTRSSVSFDAIPLTSPGTPGGAVAPAQFAYRQTTPIYSNLILRMGVGLMRFGPGGLVDIPGQPHPVSEATFRPLGFVSASYALKKNLNFDLTVARDPVPYTPLSVRMGVMESRLEAGLKYSFASRTDLWVDFFSARFSSIRFQQLGLLNGNPSLVGGGTLREPARGGSVTLLRNLLRFERASLDMGYQGRVFGFTGSQQQDYMGFFNPAFYQVHQLTTRVYSSLRGPLGYDFSGGLGVQQVDTHQPFTQALNLNPALSYKINPRLFLRLGYLSAPVEKSSSYAGLMSSTRGDF